MYEAFFEMKHTPFVNAIPVNALYLSEKHIEILGRLGYVAQGNRFAVVTASVGVGKSTLIRKFAQTLSPEKFTVLYLSDSQLTPRWFYKGLLDQLGIEAKFYRGDAKRQLQKHLRLIREIHHRNIFVAVDELCAEQHNSSYAGNIFMLSNVPNMCSINGFWHRYSA